ALDARHAPRGHEVDDRRVPGGRDRDVLAVGRPHRERGDASGGGGGGRRGLVTIGRFVPRDGTASVRGPAGDQDQAGDERRSSQDPHSLEPTTPIDEIRCYGVY